MKTKLSTLWIFATLNYLYCDVVSLMDHDLLKQYLAGRVGGMDVSQAFLLGAGILVEIPISMVLLSRVLNRDANRWANVVAGAIMTVVQTASLFVQAPALHYGFFSFIEIATTAAIIWLAWRWAAAPTLNQLSTRAFPEPN
jgi:ABC-type arginine/histidine transport system permease subunit